MSAPSPVFAALFSGFIFASCWSEHTKKRLCKEFEYSDGFLLVSRRHELASSPRCPPVVDEVDWKPGIL